MPFTTPHKPIASEQITCKGAVLNGQASLSDALQIPQSTALFEKIQNYYHPQLDPVLAFHSGWPTRNKIAGPPSQKP